METTQQMLQALIGKGMTQTKIAEESGLNQPTISRALSGSGLSYENGKKVEELYTRVCIKSRGRRKANKSN
jgi:transcriptional regulator with XRE-family HTH domain